MDLVEEFRAIILALNSARIPYAVCGGFAVAIHGFPRATQDIDLLVRAEDVATLKTAVRPLGFRLDSGVIPFNRGEPRETRVHRLVKVDGDEFLILDLLLTDVRRNAMLEGRIETYWEDIPVSVVNQSSLHRMKLEAGRPQDIQDLQRLGWEPS